LREQDEGKKSVQRASDMACRLVIGKVIEWHTVPKGGSRTNRADFPKDRWGETIDSAIEKVRNYKGGKKSAHSGGG